MGDAKKYCPKCQYVMSRGFLPDVTHGVVLQAGFHPGAPERRRWMGGVKWRPKEVEPIVAYRCEKCGYVELYVER